MNYFRDPKGAVYTEDLAPAANNLTRVVVISPQDRELVERLVMYMPVEWNLHQVDDPELLSESIAGVQAALRSLIAPPKPDEPTGLGAVVEDDLGRPWVRFKSAERKPWRLNMPFGDDQFCAYFADIDAVRVLSEGVTA